MAEVDPLAEAFSELDALAEEARAPRPRAAPTKAAPAKAAPKKPAPKKSPTQALKDRMVGGLKGYGKFVASTNTAILRAPGQLIGGNMDLLADAGDFIDKNISPSFIRNTMPLVEPAIRTAQAVRAQTKRTYGASVADVLSMRSTLGQVGYPSVNQFMTETLAIAAPTVSGKGQLAARTGKAALAGAAVMEADDLGDRARNAAISAAFELGGEAIFAGGRLVLKRVTKKATPEEAARDALDRDFATSRTKEARQQAQEAAQSGKPAEPEAVEATTPSRVQDVGPSLAEDANAALQKAGVPHTIEGDVPLSPNGKILVPAAVKEGLDDAGMGRAFAAEGTQPRDAVIFKEEAVDGSSRVVGSMGREDLLNFGASVQFLRDNPKLIDLPADSPHGQWTLSKLGSEEDTPAFLRAIVEGIPGRSTPLSQAELMEQAASAADALGSSPDDAIRFAQQIAGEQADVPTALKAAQTIWTRMGRDLDNSWQGLDLETAPDDAIDRIAAKIHDLHMFAGAFQDAKAAAGRGLQVLGLPDADSYLSALRRNLRDPNPQVAPTGSANPPPLPRTRQELREWLDMWDALKDNPQGRQAFLEGIKTYPSGSFYLRTSFANFFTGAILSGPKTILLNVLQPAFVGGLRTLERTSGAAAAAINPLLSPAERASHRAIAAQAPVAYLQTIGDVADAFKYAARTFGQDASVIGGRNPLDFNTAGVPEPMIRAAQAEGKAALPYHLGNLLNWFPRQVHRLHGTTNEVALVMAYKGEVRAKALLEAADLKLSPADTKALVTKRLTEAFDDETGAGLDLDTLDSAHRTTMIRNADPDLNPGRASFDRTVQQWRKNVPELRYVLPIYQVPANALGETIRRVPGAGFLLKETSEELSGKLGSFRQAEAYGRMMLGAGALTAGVILARQGIITGAGPQDPRDRALWLETHKPFSMRIGDQWVAYDRLDPVGPLLAIAAGYFDTSVYRDTDRDTTVAAVGALAQYLKDKAALRGISDLLNFGGDPGDRTYLTRLAGSTARGFVPAFLQIPRNAIDPELKTKRNPWDYVMDALPGASRQLDPVRNVLGEPVHKPADTLVENFLPVAYDKVTTYADDPVMDELDRLYNRTGYTPGVMSPAAGAQAHFDYRDVKLEDGKSLYNALLQARLDSRIDGLTLRQALMETINSAEYNAAPDGTGKVGDTDEGLREDTRGGMVQKVFQDYTRQTKIDVAQRSPIARRWLAVAKIKADANDVLRGTPAGDIVKNPRLLDALGISLEAYETRASEPVN